MSYQGYIQSVQRAHSVLVVQQTFQALSARPPPGWSLSTRLTAWLGGTGQTQLYSSDIMAVPGYRGGPSYGLGQGQPPSRLPFAPGRQPSTGAPLQSPPFPRTQPPFPFGTGAGILNSPTPGKDHPPSRAQLGEPSPRLIVILSVCLALPSPGTQPRPLRLPSTRRQQPLSYAQQPAITSELRLPSRHRGPSLARNDGPFAQRANLGSLLSQPVIPPTRSRHPPAEGRKRAGRVPRPGRVRRPRPGPAGRRREGWGRRRPEPGAAAAEFAQGKLVGQHEWHHAAADEGCIGGPGVCRD